MHSITGKLLLSFLTVVSVGILAVSYLANRATDSEFESYVATGGMLHDVRIAEVLAGYYGATGSWERADSLLDGLALRPQDRLVLADGQGRVVADTADLGVGRQAKELGLADFTAIYIDGHQVGQLFVVTSQAVSGFRRPEGLGPGGPGGQGRGRRTENDALMASQPTPVSPEQSFLENMNRNLWMAAIIASLLALALALLLTRQIVRPLRLLTMGANRVSAGDLAHRVPLASRDEIGQLAASFNVMASTLERNELARRNLLADVAHELRTPLSVIEGTADAMLDAVFELTDENVRVIKDQAVLLTKLIADLRDLSLAEAGQLLLAKEPTGLVELAERAIQSHEAAAREKGVRLTLEASEGLPRVLADPVRITQVLGNLITNALRHTPAGGEIIIGVHEAAPAHVRLSVADTGEGIAPEDLPRVFDRFYRVDKSRARRSGGSGLGLAIARQIILAHNGRIWVRSGQSGSVFTLELPLS